MKSLLTLSVGSIIVMLTLLAVSIIILIITEVIKVISRNVTQLSRDDLARKTLKGAKDVSNEAMQYLRRDY